MSIVTDERESLEDSIKGRQEAIEVLESRRELLEQLESMFPEKASVSHWWNQSFNAYFSVVVKDLAVEMSEHLTALEALGIPVESWTTEDEPESRKRVFCSAFSDNLTITLTACLADDATCRIEVVGHEEREEGEYVRVRRTVPITRLVCA